MKIGDKVRFLNEIGGGKVAGFQKNNIVLIEDEDGFQIPMNINEVVVVDIESDKKQSQKISTRPITTSSDINIQNGDNRSIKALIGEGYHNEDNLLNEEEENDPADSDITFEKPVEERLGGNSLHIYLCFVPNNIKELGKTPYDTYIVNDSNYYIHYTFSAQEEQVWMLRSHGEIAPNTQLFIEEIPVENINEIEHISIQMLAFKKKKDYVRKSTIDVSLRLEPLKFHKLHSYQDNDFFHSKAFIVPIIVDDKLPQNILSEITPDEIKKEMQNKKSEESLKDKFKKDKYGTVTQGKNSNQLIDKNLLVVDLHANELLETTGGMSSVDILQYQLEVFRNTLKAHAKNKGMRIVFIHGKGEGVLRRSLLHELNYRYKSYLYQDASFQEYGYGATQVTIKYVLYPLYSN